MYCEAHACAAVKDGKVRRKPRQISRGVRVTRLDCRRLIKFRPAERLPRALRSEASARIWKIRRRERREGLGMAASWMARSADAFAADDAGVAVKPTGYISPSACRRGGESF